MFLKGRFFMKNNKKLDNLEELKWQIVPYHVYHLIQEDKQAPKQKERTKRRGCKCKKRRNLSLT